MLNALLVNGKMNKEEVAPGIVLYSDVVPEINPLFIQDLEEGIISAGLEWLTAKVQSGNNTEQKIDVLTRNTNIIGIPYYNEYKEIDGSPSEIFYISLNNIFYQNFSHIEKDYENTYGITTTWHDQWGILKYGVGQKFTNHIDDHTDYHRRISTIFYLNDNYIGGEINFPRFHITIKPKANQMIIFPSTYVYNHSVSPVIEGERYAVVSWLK